MLLGKTSWARRFGKKLLLTAALFMPSQPAWAAIVTDAHVEFEITPTKTVRKKKKKKGFYRRFGDNLVSMGSNVTQLGSKAKSSLTEVHFIKTDPDKLGQIAFGEGPIHLINQGEFLKETEKQELLVSEIAQYLASNTVTALGQHGIRTMFLSHSKEQATANQAILRALVEDDVLFEKMHNLLNSYQKDEAAIMSYWDPQKNISTGSHVHLLGKARELEFLKMLEFPKTFLPISEVPQLKLPNLLYAITKASKTIGNPASSTGMAMVAWMAIILKCRTFFYEFGWLPVYNKLIQALSSKGDLENPVTTFKDGLKKALNVTVLAGTKTKHGVRYDDYWKDYVEANQQFETFKRDIAKRSYIGDFDSLSREDQLSKFSEGDLTSNQTTYEMMHGSEVGIYHHLQKRVDQLGNGLSGPIDDLIEKGSIRDVYESKTRTDGPPQKWHLGQMGLVMAAFIPDAILKALLGTIDRDGMLSIPAETNIVWTMLTNGIVLAKLLARSAVVIRSLYGVAQNIAGLHTTWCALDEHATQVARGIRSLRTMHCTLNKQALFKNNIAVKLFEESFEANKAKESFKTVNRMAHQKKFIKKGIQGGDSIKFNTHMRRTYSNFTSALQGVGYLDGLFSIAKMIRGQKGKGHQISFVEWLPDNNERAVVEIEDGTLLVMPGAKPNSISLGLESSNKAILTGPNGAGKSVFIKMFGANLILAHIFGIAAARSMKTCWFDILRTSLDPKESLSDDLSRMQAQSVRMDRVVGELIYRSRNDQYTKGIFLTDEPLSGTTHHVAADMLRMHCEVLGKIPQVCGIMATHNEEPTKFEPLGFANYQVCIKQLENGAFMPSFTIEPGIPHWWFRDDKETGKKRRDFVMYTVAQKEKSNIEKEIRELELSCQNLDKFLDDPGVEKSKGKQMKQLRMLSSMKLDFLHRKLEETKHKIASFEGAK